MLIIKPGQSLGFKIIYVCRLKIHIFVKDMKGSATAV